MTGPLIDTALFVVSVFVGCGVWCVGWGIIFVAAMVGLWQESQEDRT